MSTAPRFTLSEDQYLMLERASSTRHEFYRGEMTAMSGVSRVHSLISINLIRHLSNLLDGGPCELHGSEFRVLTSPLGFYSYPDLTIACGEVQLRDGHFDTLLNPIVLIEILSDSTEAYDRGEKFRRYQAIPSLKTYILVSQKGMAVDIFDRRPDDPSAWTLRSATGPDGILRIDSLPTPIAIPLSAVYHRLNVPPIPPVPPDADR